MKYKVSLSIAEVNHLLILLRDNQEESQWYIGPKGQWWDRSERLQDKLVKSIDKK